jgi:hypothetical protein
MKEYRLEVYGYEIYASAHSLTYEKVQRIQKLMKDKGYDELIECRWDLEETDILDDLACGDLFNVSKALNNGHIHFSVIDETDGNTVIEFEISELGDYYELLGNDDFIEKNYPNQEYSANPKNLEGIDNILLIVEKNKGGIVDFLFESDEVPTANNFCVLGGEIETPDGDLDFISKYFYKGLPLEVNENLDNNTKSTTIEIYTKDGGIIK